MIKALFFDIDGTLVSFKTHEIPRSTVLALEAAHQKGIKIFISTGRPPLFINNLGAIEHLVDGYITTNGAYCYTGDSIISISPIDMADVKSVLDTCSKLDKACIVVSRERLTMFNYKRYDAEFFKKLLNAPDFGEGDDIEEVLKTPILQLTPIVDETEEQIMVERLHKVEPSRWCPYFFDITATGVNKAKGMREIADRFGFSLDDSMAFGDGGNDISMLKAAGIGVAMGNANEPVKEIADYVTTSVDDNGISDALRDYGVI